MTDKLIINKAIIYMIEKSKRYDQSNIDKLEEMKKAVSDMEKEQEESLTYFETKNKKTEKQETNSLSFFKIIQEKIKSKIDSTVKSNIELNEKLSKTGMSVKEAKALISSKYLNSNSLIDSARKDFDDALQYKLGLRKNLVEKQKIELAILLKKILVDDIDFWKKQQFSLQGTKIVDDSGRKVTVPTGIGNLIKLIDPDRSPTKEHSYFFKKTLIKKEVNGFDDNIFSSIIQEAKSRSEAHNKKIGRTEATSMFYKLASQININNLSNPHRLKEYIKYFNKYKNQYQDSQKHRSWFSLKMKIR